MEALQKRLEALEQQTEQLKQHTQALEAHTLTVERRLRWWRRIAQGLLVLGLLTWTLPSGVKAQGEQGLAHRVRALEDRLAVLTFNAATKELTITGANLRIVNGLGRTDTTNGVGNLIVGYNEDRGSSEVNRRTGSHNVVVGAEHNFSSFGGLVVALRNEISGPWASVSGGRDNTASARFASVSGGAGNTASGDEASVSGGEANFATTFSTSISGGIGNVASGYAASITAGEFNRATAFTASVSGGESNTASGGFASVSGGAFNTAAGNLSSVSGGSTRTAPGTFNWAAGALFQPN